MLYNKIVKLRSFAQKDTKLGWRHAMEKDRYGFKQVSKQSLNIN